MSERITDLVDAQIRRSELSHVVRDEETGPVPEERWPVVTISRQLGSGGRRVAEKLADTLEFSIWDAELVEQMAKDASVAERLVKSFDERAVSEIDVLVRHLVGEPRIGGFQYKRHLTRTILQIARLGNAIILGRGANFILPHALNVRIVGSRELRIDNMIQFEGQNRNEAMRAMDASDSARADFSRRIWGREWNDPIFYDMVIRMDEFTNDQAAQVLAEALRIRTEQQGS